MCHSYVIAFVKYLLQIPSWLNAPFRKKIQTPPNAVDLLCSCEGVFLLCYLGQIVT